MTEHRYNAYQQLRADLDGLSDVALNAEEREILRDAAEALLLARDGADDQVDEARGRAATALSLLVGLGRWTDAAADELWERLIACGPITAAGAREEPVHA